MPGALRGQDGLDDVVNVDIGLALLAVTKYAQAARVVEKTTDEIEAHAVCLARANDVAESERPRSDAEHGRVGRQERFAR